MLDLNITLVFQLVNFFIALYVLNLLLIRPIREIIRKRKAVMDDVMFKAFIKYPQQGVMSKGIGDKIRKVFASAQTIL